MGKHRYLVVTAIVAAYALAATAPALAQFGPPRNPVTSIDSPYPYKSAKEHYEALKKNANGGTKHTVQTLPDWSGYWNGDGSVGLLQIGGRNVRDKSILMKALKPEYQKIFQKTLDDAKAGKEWDPLSYCLPPGYPRWYSEYGLHEFIVRPEKVWLIGEMMNEVRRIYTDGREHTPEEMALPLWLGDSIGFWDGDTLVISTVQLRKNILQREMPSHSDKMETVETWRKASPDRIEIEITMYDTDAFTKPWYTKAAFVKEKDPDLRSRYWACAENNNVVRNPDGSTQLILPSDEGFKDPNNPEGWAGGEAPATEK
jgi:hypothetical protein